MAEIALQAAISGSKVAQARILDFGQIPSIFRHKIRSNKRNLH